MEEGFVEPANDELSNNVLDNIDQFENENQEEEEEKQENEEINSDEDNDDEVNKKQVPSCGTIKSVDLKNFMCHENLHVSFKRGINFIVGQNGSSNFSFRIFTFFT